MCERLQAPRSDLGFSYNALLEPSIWMGDWDTTGSRCHQIIQGFWRTWKVRSGIIRLSKLLKSGEWLKGHRIRHFWFVQGYWTNLSLKFARNTRLILIFNRSLRGRSSTSILGNSLAACRSTVVEAPYEMRGCGVLSWISLNPTSSTGNLTCLFLLDKIVES